MKNKTFKNSLIVYILGIILFNILIFTIPFDKNLSRESFWCVLISSNLFFFFSIITFFQLKKIKCKKIYIFNIYFFLVLLSLIQIIAAYILLIIGNFLYVKLWISLIVEIILLFMNIIFFIFSFRYLRYLLQEDSSIKSDTSFIEAIRLEINELLLETTLFKIKKSLNNLLEKIKYIDPVSTESTQKVEDDIVDKINELKNSISKRNITVSLKIIENISNLIEKRSLIK